VGVNGYFRTWWGVYSAREKQWIVAAFVTLGCIITALIALWGHP